MDAKAIEDLKQALRRLPGIGPKSAQRMAFHLLERDREGARQITEALRAALEEITACRRCNNFSESELCSLCASRKRDPARLCVVETPADLEAIEQSGIYQGTYFVMMGRLSPLEGIGPEALRLDKLRTLVEEEQIEEVILATNLTLEGQATADFIIDLLESMQTDPPLAITRLASGLPVGGELEYMDADTLHQAFNHRRRA